MLSGKIRCHFDTDVLTGKVTPQQSLIQQLSLYEPNILDCQIADSGGIFLRVRDSLGRKQGFWVEHWSNKLQQFLYDYSRWETENNTITEPFSFTLIF